MSLYYNYVVFGSNDPYYTLGYSELESMDNAVYYGAPAFEGKLNVPLQLIRRVHMSPKIGKHVTLPGKKLWNSKLYQSVFLNEKPICFLFFSAGPFAEHIPYGFIECLKATNPHSKFVVFYQDLIGANRRRVSLEDYKRLMNLIVSFDFEDCKRYDLLYHPLVYSDITDRIMPLQDKSDIYFCGAEKNRLHEIRHAFEYFASMGFKCDFNVITSNRHLLRKKNDGIHYCKNFSYLNNLRHAKSSKCTLEIMQKGGTGFTIRPLECIALNRKLITNNEYMSEASFYDNENYMIYRETDSNEAYASFIEGEPTTYSHMNEILPHGLLSFIDENLKKA